MPITYCISFRQHAEFETIPPMLFTDGGEKNKLFQYVKFWLKLGIEQNMAKIQSVLKVVSMPIKANSFPENLQRWPDKETDIIYCLLSII